MFGSIFNDLQKFINDLRKLVLFFTQALYAASTYEPGVACALERYRLANGGYPESLQSCLHSSSKKSRLT